MSLSYQYLDADCGSQRSEFNLWQELLATPPPFRCGHTCHLSTEIPLDFVLRYIMSFWQTAKQLDFMIGSRWSTSGTPITQAISTTQKIKSISREARQNQLISERLNEWQAKMRGRGECPSGLNWAISQVRLTKACVHASSMMSTNNLSIQSSKSSTCTGCETRSACLKRSNTSLKPIKNPRF